MALNRDWHLANKMPKNPTLDQRMEWHVAHAKNCACRRPSGKILEEMTRRGFVLPDVQEGPGTRS